MGIFIAYLMGILTALRATKPDQATGKQDKSSTEHNDGTVGIVRAEIATPVPISVKNEPQERHPKLQLAKTIAEIIGISAAVVLAVITVLQWREAHRNFLIDERAWVGIRHPTSITVISNGPQESTITYVVNLQNYGKSVATRVWLTTNIVTDPQDIVSYIDASCKESNDGTNAILHTWNADKAEKAVGFVTGDTIFPTEEEGKWFYNISFKRTGVLFIVGCAVYKDQFGTTHHTRFCDWSQIDITKLSASDLPLMIYPFFGANDAD